MESQGLGKAFHGGEHYENFPVGSWLIAKPMRKAVLALYRFARLGDDLADEGGLSVNERLAGLQALEEGLQGPPCEGPHAMSDAGPPLATTKAIGAALRAELDARSIPIAPVLALLSAFRQDVHNPILKTEDDVLDYCRRSANPIGQLVLAFAGLVTLRDRDCELIHHSNAICTGLQLANFAQDMGQDFSRGRIYVPQSWAGASSLLTQPLPALQAGETVTDLRWRGRQGSEAIEIVTKMARWAQQHLRLGQGLPKLIRCHPRHASLRLALEVALTLQGGNSICKKVLRRPAAVWTQSPTLSKAELPVLLFRSLATL
jgi:hydroxysqualene synthase